MPSQRALAGVAHDIAHHASSGVCYIHPHLYRACESVGVREAAVDLMVQRPYPTDLPSVEPLRLSFIALRETFFSILQANGFSVPDIGGISLRFQFPFLGADGYTCQVVARLQSARGQSFAAVVG